MKVCNNYQSLIIDVASGAAGEGDRLRLEEHITTCAGCAVEFARTNSIVSIARLQQTDPGEAYWDGYYGHLTERMEGEASPGTSSKMLPERTAGGALRLGLERMTEFLFPRQRWVLQLAVAILLVATGVLFGRFVFTPSSDSPVLAENGSSEALLQQAALEARAHTYLDRSKTLLLGLVNFNVDVAEEGDKVVFLHKIIPGGADRSYGIHVARLAGMPGEVLQRAKVILTNLEAETLDVDGKPKFATIKNKEEDKPKQMTLFNPPQNVVIEEIRNLDTSKITPIEALNKLHKLKEKLEE